MTLVAGQSLSHYEVLGSLGAGAMGELYRARDTRLEREVALKVLPDELADDDELLERFEREAKSLATLNHPNVAQVVGIDRVGDTCFIAMELVPGEDLEKRLRRGTLPLESALEVCCQIAAAVQAAHEAGVVHRDLKPANVIVTPEGRVEDGAALSSGRVAGGVRLRIRRERPARMDVWGRDAGESRVGRTPHGGPALNEIDSPIDRIQTVRRIFVDQRFGNVEMLEDWDGGDLEELRDLLSEEEFQTLLDQLEGPDDDRSG